MRDVRYLTMNFSCALRDSGIPNDHLSKVASAYVQFCVLGQNKGL